MMNRFSSALRYFDSRWSIHATVGLGLLLRLIALGLLAHQALVGDDTLYGDFAVRLLQGRMIYPYLPPTPGYYLTFFTDCSGVAPLIARACTLPVYICFAYVLYVLVMRLIGSEGIG